MGLRIGTGLLVRRVHRSYSVVPGDYGDWGTIGVSAVINYILINTPDNQYVLKQYTDVPDTVEVSIRLWVDENGDGNWLTVSHFSVDNSVIVSMIETLSDLERSENSDGD